ncbi:MAG: ABC transporter ATP-binding protein [Acidobacteriota bacterium]|nr:ABC transporter ATP-binding protein [Acidobacteriota bacterium]MDQ5871960.1 ABC transporter ATP-binding protein [Acidobacteriota bacterium]
MSTEPAVDARSVTKFYRRWGRKRSVGTLKSALLSGRPGRALAPDDAVPALSDVSFQVAPGETVGIVGPNGSGKSTLLKLLAGIIQPSSGSVTVRGRLAALLELGAGFHPEISGRENIQINGLLLGLSRKEIASRFDQIVRFAELEEFLDAPVKTYSSGMAVRLGFSIAAHCDPDVLLVDEVLAVGDEAFARRSLEKFAEFERAGKTLLLVSHDLALVAERCRRAIWLDHGRVAADGPSAETVARYRESVAEKEAERRAGAPQPESEPAPGVSRRVGSGAATVATLRLVDAEGRPASRLESGRPARFVLEVQAPSGLADFVFGIAISTVAGAPVFGSNTDMDGLVPEELRGEATVALEIPSLDLAAGVYSVDAAVHARDGSPYDYRRDLLRFEVSAERSATGVWSPRHAWSFSGGVRWRGTSNQPS